MSDKPYPTGSGHRERLIVFTRYPAPGTTKTRLIPHLGAQGAADLQRRLTERVLAQARMLKTLRGLTLEVCHSGGNRPLMKAWLGGGLTFTSQGEGDLGRRMARALGDAMQQGALAAVLVGSDIPGITTALLDSAFEKIADQTVILGPARDGGYYLIGLSPPALTVASPSIFKEMDWGAATVLTETCRRLERLGLSYRLLDPLDDVDRPEDLSVWERHRQP